MPEKVPHELRFSGGMNNLNTPLDLFQRKQGEVPLMINVDTSLPGVILPLKTLRPLNTVAGENLHSLFVGSGLNVENVQKQLAIADGAIVGTAFKKNGVVPGEPIDVEMVEKLMAEVEKLRKK